MRIPLLAANWKMYKTAREALAYVREFERLVKTFTDVEIVLAPPFTLLHSAAEAAHNTAISIAAQNLYFEREGAFTGEVSAAMVKDACADYVIIGHSERRRLFGDTDEWVNRKLHAALAADLGPRAALVTLPRGVHDLNELGQRRDGRALFLRSLHESRTRMEESWPSTLRRDRHDRAA